MTCMYVNMTSGESRFQPVRIAHAIQEAVFYGQFFPPMKLGAISHFADKLQVIESFLPIKNEVKKFDFAMNEDGGSSFSQTIGGIEFRRLDSFGNILWLLRLTDEGVSVHCLDYTRWHQVWPQARELMLNVLFVVPVGTALSGIGLKYVDRFRYTGNEEDYAIDGFFQTPNSYLSNRCFTAGFQWHCHTGWFGKVRSANEQPSNGLLERCLNQLNITSNKEVSPAGTGIFITIDHNLLVNTLSIDDMKLSVENDPWFDNLMNALHNDNKRTMIALLSESVTRRLNLAI